MKQITEIDDPRIVKGLAHPLRIHILRVLQERTASPSEIASQSDASLGTISYHVRYLERVGLIELKSTKARRGAVEHYYRSVGRLRITDNAWAALPDVVKEGLLGSTLDRIGQVVSDAAAAGGFSREDVHVSRRALQLDAEGFADLAAALSELDAAAHQIERESAERMAGGKRPDGEIDAGLILMLYDAAGADVSRTADGASDGDGRDGNA